MYLDANINDIVVTQNSLRDPKKVKRIVVSMMMGEEIDTVKLYHMEDGKLFIHDGHHRLTASYILKGRCKMQVLSQEFTYSKFTEINHDVGWVTPHDVTKYVRHGDLYYWKNYVNQRKKQLSIEKLDEEIFNSLDEYAEPREVWGVHDFVKNSEYLQDLFLTVRR
jgi:uncharacterized protein (DUF1015 family)